MTTASKITLARVALIPLYMVLMYLSNGQSSIWMLLALGVFIFASVTDFVDGYIARHYNQVSDFGKFLDPLADKLLTLAAMCMFCQWGTFPAWALMIATPGNAIQTHRPIMVEAVLNLPLLPAAMTLPLGPATIRRPLTANSRVNTIIRAHAGKKFHSQYILIAAMVSSLSARGSRNLPKSLTWLYFRAI